MLAIIIIIIIGCGLSMLISAVVWLLRQGKGSKRSRVHYWGYGPKGPYGGWYRDPWSLGERVSNSIENGRRTAAEQHFSSHKKKRMK